MPADRPDNQTQTTLQPRFVTTHWSVVLMAQDKTSPDSQQALEKLCRTYWYPLTLSFADLGTPHMMPRISRKGFS